MGQNPLGQNTALYCVLSYVRGIMSTLRGTQQCTREPREEQKVKYRSSRSSTQHSGPARKSVPNRCPYAQGLEYIG